jgi:UDP-3-O-[3-hydroxymyristoyl] glucosamine N-acyltransferase
MDLNKITNSLRAESQLFGNVEFETLALAGTQIKKRKLIFIDNIKYADADNCVVLTTPDIAAKLKPTDYCLCAEPRELFFKIHNFLATDASYIRNRFITKIGGDCSISPLAYIAPANVVIGNGVIIEEFVSIKENTVVGDGCVIRTGSVVGGEGFEQKRVGDVIEPIKHLGGVELGKNVEIQQLCAIDKALFPWDNTIIEDYCKFDNLVHVAHAVKIKRNVLAAACALIAGRTVVGENAWIGPAATVINGISVGSGARVNIGSVATRDVPDNATVTGNFALEHSKFIRNLKKANET